MIDPAKVRDYLLSPTHPVGRYKARVFEALGYQQGRWQDLAEDLRSHARVNDAAVGTPSRYGTKYEVRGPLPPRNGPSMQFCVVWIVRVGENVPSLVTAYPEGT
jgi:hypothetical protein